MTAQEFPDAQLGDFAHGIRAWYDARRHAAFAAISAARSASTPAVAATSATSATAARDGAGDTRIADLERLANLRDRGALTEEEFRAQKAMLLGPGALG